MSADVHMVDHMTRSLHYISLFEDSVFYNGMSHELFLDMEDKDLQTKKQTMVLITHFVLLYNS